MEGEGNEVKPGSYLLCQYLMTNKKKLTAFFSWFGTTQESFAHVKLTLENQLYTAKSQ